MCSDHSLSPWSWHRAGTNAIRGQVLAEADVINAVVELLKADADVAAVVGARVFGGELPAEETASMPRAAIVLQPSGGSLIAAGSFMAQDTQRIDVLCFEQSPATANGLSRLVRGALRGVRRQVVSGCLIHWVETAGGISARRDSETQWSVAFQPFQVFHALQEVS